MALEWFSLRFGCEVWMSLVCLYGELKLRTTRRGWSCSPRDLSRLIGARARGWMTVWRGSSGSGARWQGFDDCRGFSRDRLIKVLCSIEYILRILAFYHSQHLIHIQQSCPPGESTSGSPRQYCARQLAKNFILTALQLW